MSKFKDLSKSKIFNPIDWFNFYGDFSIIFTDNRNANIINENEVSFYSDENIRKPTFVLNAKNLVNVKKENEFDLATGIEISKFMLLTICKFKGNYTTAMSFVYYNLMKSEIPYIRVGTDYFKVIEKPNRYSGKNTIIKVWDKATIVEDHTKELMKYIFRYDEFTIEPNNKIYTPVIDGCYNLYSKFSHSEHIDNVTLDDIPFSNGIMQHFFGEQVEAGFRYMKILYEYPKQMLPILVLVSEERGTGKTTFLNWIEMIFGENSILISPDALTRDFNALYSNKNIICIDETLIEKSHAVEKLKSLATAKSISVAQKFVSEYSIPFYGKLILCTNKETDFMRIDEDEVRFWIRKLNHIDNLNTMIEKDIFKEIPKFLKYLSSLPEIDFSKSRMVFTKEEICTENLLNVKEESKSGLFKELCERFEDYFNDKEVNSLEATPTDIKDKWFRNDSKVSASYIKKVLKNEFKLIPSDNKYYYSILSETSNKKMGRSYFIERSEYFDYNPKEPF